MLPGPSTRNQQPMLFAMKGVKTILAILMKCARDKTRFSVQYTSFAALLGKVGSLFVR